MKHREDARENPQHHTPGERPDHRRARSDWQRQQYRVAEPGFVRDGKPGPDELDDGGG